MFLLIISTIILTASGIFSLVLSMRNDKYASYAGAAGPVIALILCIIPSLSGIAGVYIEPAAFPWALPFAELSIKIDPLSAFFMLPVLVLCAAGAVYGTKYMEHNFSSGRACPSWLWYNLLEAGMLGVLVSGNAVMFLISWELMSVASFFLVMTEHAEENVRSAGWIYLIATHIGTFFIVAVFVLLALNSGSFDFNPNIKITAMLASVIFIFAVIGFGAKAGFVPFHVWLPEAHPAAPSHVSAVMSGAMIKIGLYGLLRIITLIDGLCAWYGWLLLSIGLASCFFGIICAFAQSNVKRLLAYSSVENMGIITIGIGLGILGISYDRPLIVFLGFGGALLHVLNHSFFKGLLFMCAGNVLHETGTANMEKLGGLIKRMPWTGGAFLLGSASICALPPFNGFMSEFLIYVSSFSMMTPLAARSTTAALLVICILALSGGIALAAFTKAIGIIFLGEPRTVLKHEVTEVPARMKIPVMCLAAGCVILAFGSPVIIPELGRIVCVITGSPAIDPCVQSEALEFGYIITCVCIVFMILMLVFLILKYLRSRMLKGIRIEKSPTWDCGYCRPSAKMQYTGSSYSSPLVKFFQYFIMPVVRARFPDRRFFPGLTFFEMKVPDLFNRLFFGKMFIFIRNISNRLKWIQAGNVQLYILYVTLALLTLLIIKLFMI